jgi:hypothetical protein
MIKKLFLVLLIFCVSNAKDLSNLDDRFVQRWNYMSICDFAYQNAWDQVIKGKLFHNDTPFNPKDVFPGSVIFLTGYGAIDFFKYIHPEIENPYIIVQMFDRHPGPILDDPKIIHFFCACGGGDGPLKNNHPKYSYLPVGIQRELYVYRDQNQLKDLFLQLRAREKTKMVYMNITLHSCTPWRHEIYNAFKDRPYVFSTNKRKGFVDYMNEMADCKFAISPRGDALDCYRHWEAIMVGCIPIMQRSELDCLFEGLPVLIIDDWYQLTEDFLNQKYKEIKSKNYDYSKLYLRYWVDRINEIKSAHGFEIL